MTNLTPLDNSQRAVDRTVPNVSQEYTISLTDADAGEIQLDNDVKSAVIRVDGAAIKFWPSYDDGSTDVLAGTTITSTAAAAATAKTIKNVPDSSSFQEAQESEFNKINAVITAGTGTCTVYIYPGYGVPNNV